MTSYEFVQTEREIDRLVYLWEKTRLYTYALELDRKYPWVGIRITK